MSLNCVEFLKAFFNNLIREGLNVELKESNDIFTHQFYPDSSR